MDLVHIYGILMKRKLLLAVAILAGVVFALLSFYRIQIIPSGIFDLAQPGFSAQPRSLTQYETVATLIVDIPGFGLGRTDHDVGKAIELAPTYAYLAISEEVMSKVRQEFSPLDATVTSRSVDRRPVVHIIVQGNDQAYITRVARSTAQAFIAYLHESQVKAGIPPEKRIIVRELATPSPALPLQSRQSEIALILFLGPILLGIIVVFVLENIQRSIGKEAITRAAVQGQSGVAPARGSAPGRPTTGKPSRGTVPQPQDASGASVLASLAGRASDPNSSGHQDYNLVESSEVKDAVR